MSALHTELGSMKEDGQRGGWKGRGKGMEREEGGMTCTFTVQSSEADATISSWKGENATSITGPPCPVKRGTSWRNGDE